MRSEVELTVSLSPASAATISGSFFADSKKNDAYGSPLEAIVMCLTAQLQY